MDARILKNVLCGICLEIFTEPKQLKCCHIFCRWCIDKSFRENRVNQYNGYNCPTCRAQTVLTAAGAKELNDAPFELKDIIETVKKSGDGFLQEYAAVVKSEKSKCPKHPKEMVEFLCQCSSDPFCKLCKEEHEKHEILTLSKVISEMIKMREEVEAKINSVQQERTIVEDCLKTLNISKTKATTDLESAFKKVEKKKEKSAKSLDESYDQEKRKLLHTQENLSESLQCANAMRETLSNIFAFRIDGHTLSSWKKLQEEHEKLKGLRQEELSLRKCVFKFIPEHPNSWKLGRFQKTKARRNCYVLMQQNEKEEFWDDSDTGDCYDVIVSDYTSEEESSQGIQSMFEDEVEGTAQEEDVHQEVYADEQQDDGMTCYEMEPFVENFELQEVYDDGQSACLYYEEDEGEEIIYETEPALNFFESQEVYDDEATGSRASEQEVDPQGEKKRVVVIYDYDAEADDELDLKEGDILNVTNVIDEGWWEGIINGRTGLFPSSYVEVLEDNKPTGTMKDTKRRARVLYEYEPKDKDELKLREGDIIVVIKEETEDWCEGISNGKTGLFPSYFVEMLDDGKTNEATGGQPDVEEPPPIPTRTYNTNKELSNPIHRRPPMPIPRKNRDISPIVPPVPIRNRPPVPHSSKQLTKERQRILKKGIKISVPPVPIGNRPPVPHSNEESTKERQRILKKDIKISGGTILKRNLLMLCSHEENKVLVIDLTNENHSVSKAVNGVWDAAAESRSGEFAFVSKLRNKKTKKGSGASIVKIYSNGEEREVFTDNVKQPMGLAYARDKLFVCEPLDRKVVVFCTKSKEKIGSVKFEGFEYPWFVCASCIDDLVFISDHDAGKIFRVKNKTKDVKGYMAPKLYTKSTEFLPGKCTCFNDKVYVCDQKEKSIKCLSSDQETLYVVKACQYRPFLILINCTTNRELVIVSLNGDIEFFEV